jgi:hypothetical protein
MASNRYVMAEIHSLKQQIGNRQTMFTEEDESILRQLQEEMRASR